MLKHATDKGISNIEYKRYARQITLKEVNIQGQQRLKMSKVLCVGAGGLNSPVLLYLVACGIGTIGVIDQDRIEISNLQRQILYRTKDLNEYKASTALNILKSLNPNVKVNSYITHLNKSNVQQVLLNYDIIVDGTDDFEARYLISQYCYSLHKVHVYGAIDQFIGHLSIFNYQSGSHYYDIHSKASRREQNSCSERGLVNTLAGFIGTLQATEVIKLILGIGSVISGDLLIYNILENSLNRITINKNKTLGAFFIKAKEKSNTKYISIKSLQNCKEYLIIDVRTSLEFKIRKINQSINIPLNILKKDTLIRHLKQTVSSNILLYCDNQRRSYIASQILRKHNVKHYILKEKILNIRKERDSNPR